MVVCMFRSVLLCIKMRCILRIRIYVPNLLLISSAVLSNSSKTRFYHPYNGISVLKKVVRVWQHSFLKQNQ